MTSQLTPIQLVQGDITQQTTDAIVNAANCRLSGGGGVDGAIHRFGGPTIKQETQRHYPQGCQTGSAVITTAGHLSTKYVIHAVGPIWTDGYHCEPELLRSAYRTSLALATTHDFQSIAFPAISTGAYGYPLQPAAHIALETCLNFKIRNDVPLSIRFVLYNIGISKTFETALAQCT